MRAWAPTLLIAWGVARPGDTPAPSPTTFDACDASDARKYPQRFPDVPLGYVPTALAPPIEVGTAHPIMLVASSPDARWTAFAEAREDTNGDGRVEVFSCSRGVGGDFRLYLARGAGPGEPIDGLVDGSRDGRHLAIVRGRSIRLLDTMTGDETDLGPVDDHAQRVADEDDSPRLFDDAGTRFVRTRTTTCGTSVVVRTLADGRERELPLPADRSHRAWIDDAGAWILARTESIDGRVTTWAAPATEGSMTPVPGFVTVVGRYLIRRLPAGALVARTTDGAEQEWVPAGCWGEVLARSPALERLLVACRLSDGVLTLNGSATRCALPAHVPRLPHVTATVDQMAVLRPPTEAAVTVDLAAAAVVDTYGVDVPQRPTIWPRRRSTSHGGFDGNVWFDRIAQAYRVVEGPVRGVDAHGRLLVPAGYAVHGYRAFDVGPLTWRRPASAPSAPTPAPDKPPP